MQSEKEQQRLDMESMKEEVGEEEAFEKDSQRKHLTLPAIDGNATTTIIQHRTSLVADVVRGGQLVC